ncbi:hypothetical protein [Clostridium sp. Marseille-Q7071]
MSTELKAMTEIDDLWQLRQRAPRILTLASSILDSNNFSANLPSSCRTYFFSNEGYYS